VRDGRRRSLVDRGDGESARTPDGRDASGHRWADAGSAELSAREAHTSVRVMATPWSQL